MLNIILNIAILSSIGIVILLWRKYLPSYLSEKAKNLATKEDIAAITKEVESVRLQYSKELEKFRVQLQRELELMKISQAELQLHKTEQFVKFIDYFNTFFADKKQQQAIQKNQNEKDKFNKNMLDLGVKLFFFASDSTVKKYIEWRFCAIKPQNESPDPMNLMRIYGDLILEIRKDLGYRDTKCDHNDFLNIMLTDWWKHQESFNNGSSQQGH
jgi:hypothetical protein